MPDRAAASSMVDMSTLAPDPARNPVDYEAAEGLDQAPPVHVEITAEDWRRDRARHEWMLIGLVLTGLVALFAIVVAVFAFATRDAAAPARPAVAPAVM